MPLKQIHIRFKQIRTKLGLSQIDFATRVQIKQSQVSQIETGTRDITDTIFQQLEENIKANRNWLITGEGEVFTDVTLAAGQHKERVSGNAAPPKGNSAIKQAHRLRFFREQERISPEQMASELGVNKSTISKYENARLLIPTSTIIYLHGKYQLSYEWILDGAGNMKTKPGTITTGQHADTLTMLIAKIDYLEKQLNKEREARVKLRKEVDKLSLQIS